MLRTGGLLWTRLASTIGQETRVRPLGGRRYRAPDNTERFLVDEPFLMDATEKLNGQLADPIKTTVVQNLRSMTTWVLLRGLTREVEPGSERRRRRAGYGDPNYSVLNQVSDSVYPSGNGSPGSSP